MSAVSDTEKLMVHTYFIGKAHRKLILSLFPLQPTSWILCIGQKRGVPKRHSKKGEKKGEKKVLIMKKKGLINLGIYYIVATSNII